MFLLSKLRAILKKYKKQFLLSLFTAGCLTIGYFIIKDKTIEVTLSTFKQLIQSESIKEVILKGNELEFKTLLPDLFSVNLQFLSTLEIRELVGSVPVTEIDPLSFLQKYRHVMYGVIGVTGSLLTRLTLKTARMIGRVAIPKVKKLKNLKSKLMVKINEIPKAVRTMKQILLINLVNRLVADEIEMRGKKGTVTICGDGRLEGREQKLGNRIVLLKSLDFNGKSNENLMISLGRVMGGNENILIVSGKILSKSLGNFEEKTMKLSVLEQEKKQQDKDIDMTKRMMFSSGSPYMRKLYCSLFAPRLLTL